MTAPTALLEPEVAPPNTVLFRGLTVDEIDAYEARLEALTLEAMRRVMRQVTRNLGRTTTAAMVAAVDPAGISPDDLAGIIPLWQTQLDEHLLPVVSEIYRDSSGALTAQMLEQVGNPPPVSSAAAEAYLARSRAQFAEVGGELWEQARNQLLDGMAAGESVPQIADRLRTTTPALTNRTASLIARTQVNDAANAGSFDTARVSGLDLLKGWESTADLRTRETHLMAGSTYSGPGMIGLDAPFMVGGWPCLRPHDLSLPPEERYNCRCTLIYMMRGSELTASEQVIRDLEAERVARLAALQAQHNQQLDQLLAQHAQRVAVMEQQHAARTAVIEARYQAKLAQIQQSADTATVVAQSIAKAKAAHQLRLAQWEADYQLRTAKRVAEYEQRVLLRNTYFDQRRAVLDAEYQHRLAVAKGQTPGPLASKPIPTEPATGLPPVKYRLDTKALEGVTDPETVARITEALDWYRGIGFSAINRSLRGAIPESAKVTRTVQAIDDAMAASPLPSDAVVYRGIRGGASFFRRDISQWDADLTGFEWQDLGLASTAPTSRRVTGYALGDKDDATILRITVPKGTQALQISTDPVADTAEIVLTRGLRFRVVADHGKDAAGFRRLDVEVVPSGLPSTPLPTGPAVTVPVTGQPTLVPVRASLLRATTVPEVRKAFIQEWQRIVKANPGAIRGAARFAPGGDVQTAREHAEGLLRAIERFPHTRLDVTYGSMPHYAETAARRVSFATEYAHARDDYLLSLRLSGATGPDGTAYHPITISSPQGIALHEFGHALQYGLAFDQQGVYDYGLYLQVNRRVRKLVQDLADERGVSADDLIRMEIGGYAQEGGTGELVAEAFADVMVNGDQASALSQRIFRLLVDDYDRLNPPGPGVAPFGGPALPSAPAPVADGLDLLELHSLRSLATEFEIPNAARLAKPRLIKELRARNVISPAEARRRQLGRVVSEALDLLQAAPGAIGDTGLLERVIDALRKLGGADEVIAKLRAAPHGRRTLIRRLTAFAEQRGLTLLTETELKAVRAAEAKTAREAAKAAAQIKRQVKAVERGDFSSLVRVGPQAGGNPGGVFEDASGQRWYVKQYRNEEQARSEALALAFYRAAGLDAPDMVIGSGAPDIAGKGVQVATRLLPDAKTDLLDRLANDPAYIAKVREGFALDAWLANWDVVGLDAGNIVSSAGVPWRIDAGGVLRWRALGEPKGSAFGDNVVEWLTLRDPTRAAQASQIFQGMTRQQLLDAVARVKKLTPARIQSLVSRYGLDAKLAARLIARRADLLEQAARELDLVGNYRLMLRTAKRGKPALDEAPVRLSYPHQKLTGITDPTGEIGNALGNYRSMGYESINGGLRRGAHPTPSVIRQIDHIDQALDRSELRSDVVVFRGFKTGRSVFGDRAQWGDLAGFEWRELGYVSSSVSRTKVTEFTMGYDWTTGKDVRGVLMRVIAPKGTNAIQLSGLNYEGELMLDRGLLFRVVKDYGDDKNGVRVLDVEVISRITPRTPVT